MPAIICWDVDHNGVETQVSQNVIPSGYGRTPGIGSGNRAICVIATASALPITVAIAGDGASAVYALPDVDNYLGVAEVRFAVWGSTLAIGTMLGVSAAPDGVTGVYVGNRGNIYLCTDAGVHVSTIPAAMPVESLAMNASTVWALSTGDVYPFDRTTAAAGASFACDGSAIFVDTAGALCYVKSSSVYRRADDAWVLLGTMTGPVDTTHFFGASTSQVYAASGVEKLTDGVDQFSRRPDLYPTYATWTRRCRATVTIGSTAFIGDGSMGIGSGSGRRETSACASTK